jgi:tetratricopeptide (TPR) repeat protein
LGLRSTIIVLALFCLCTCGQAGSKGASVRSDADLHRVRQMLKLDREKNYPPGYLQGFEFRDRIGVDNSWLTDLDASKSKEAGLGLPGKVEDILNGIIARKTDSDETYVLLGVLHSKVAVAPPHILNHLPDTEEDRWARAKKAFENALRINPDNRDAVWGLVLHDSRPKIIYWPRPEEQIKKSVELCLKHLEWDRNNELALLSLGIFYYHLPNRNDQTEQAFLHLLKLPKTKFNNRFHLEAMEYLGKLYTRKGQFDLAEETLNNSVELFNKVSAVDPTAYYKGCPYAALGELYQRMKRPKKSRKFFVKAGDYDMAVQKRDFKKSLTAFAQGEYDDAAAFVDKAWGARSNDVAQKCFLGSVAVLRSILHILEKKYSEAESDFAEAKIKDPQNPGVQVGEGHLRIVERDYPGAMILFESAIRDLQKTNGYMAKVEASYRDFVHDMACLGMGWVMANQSRHNRALLYYDKILANTPDHLLALQSKGVACTALHKLDEAEKLFAKVLKIQPDNQYALAELGIVKLNQGNDEEAEKLFTQALDQDQEHYTCPYEGLGLVYLKKGDLTSAKKNFEKAISINPNMEYKKFNGLAKIYIQEGRREEAKKLLKKSIENHPYDNEAEKLLKSLQ